MTRPTPSAIYTLNNIIQAYGQRTVLQVPSLTIRKNSFIGLEGPNGSGKSTLLRILAFVETPKSGSVLFEGSPVNGRWGNIRRHVTLLTQEPYLLQRSVEANVSYGLKVRKEKNISKKVAHALAMVGLPAEQFSTRSRHELSGGEAQRVALASRLVLKPRVLLLDEPTTSLDAKSAQRIKNVAVSVRREWGTTVVAASHDKPWLNAVCDTILTLEEGRIQQP